MECPQILREKATLENFDEDAYLNANRDVNEAVKKGLYKNGKAHFEKFGFKENRFLQFLVDHKRKKLKLERIRKILASDIPMIENDANFDFLTPDLKKQFNIKNTDLISSNNYDLEVKELIANYEDGLVLDCGAGSRNEYYSNVVNFEIVPYPSTDVCGVGEKLPFISESFDAVISVAVLEHVKDPWRCAKEIVRVLKPGGQLFCCVPFLQPMHGYPDHYYNMTESGLKNLFIEDMDILKHSTNQSTLPIWTLSWILNSWAEGLSEKTRKDFLGLKVSDLMDSPLIYLDKKFVTELPEKKNMELASATIIRCIKKY